MERSRSLKCLLQMNIATAEQREATRAHEVKPVLTDKGLGSDLQRATMVWVAMG